MEYYNNFKKDQNYQKIENYLWKNFSSLFHYFKTWKIILKFIKFFSKVSKRSKRIEYFIENISNIQDQKLLFRFILEDLKSLSCTYIYIYIIDTMIGTYITDNILKKGLKYNEKMKEDIKKIDLTNCFRISNNSLSLICRFENIVELNLSNINFKLNLIF